MYAPALLLALVAGASATSWSDTAKLVGTTANGLGPESFHGPGLVYKGEVWNGDKTVRFSTASYVAKSVMTGKDSYYPASLPETLRTPYLTPDSTHPELAFWYTPDAFERDGTADGAKVSEWKNVANICYQGFHTTVAKTADAYDLLNQCTYHKKANSQAVAGGNNKHVEALKQDNAIHQPIYKKNVVNGHGVVRFRRADKHGFDGQFLEMHKRCTDFTCGTASTDAGFVDHGGNDWTNSVTGAANTKFTMFMVMKTVQTPGDVNPMGILQVTKGSAADGFGLYKIPSKCKPKLKSTIAATKIAETDGGVIVQNHIHFKTDDQGTLRSKKPGAYNGMYVHFLEAAVANAPNRYTGLVCKIEQYLIVGYVTVGLAADGQTTITIAGDGSGTATVSGWLISNKVPDTDAYPTLRFGSLDTATAHAAGDKIITAAAANGANIELTIASTDFSTNTLAVGTAVYFATGNAAGEFYSTIVSGCTGTKLDSATASPRYNGATPTTLAGDVEIIAGDGINCKNDPGLGHGPMGRFSTLSAVYGAANAAASLDDAGDAGCETECNEFGCDAHTSNFGNPTKVLVGTLATALIANNEAFALIKDGAGLVAGWKPWDHDAGGDPWDVKLRFGNQDVAWPTVGDVAIKAATLHTDGTSTKLEFTAAADFTGNGNADNVPAGTPVYLSYKGGDFTNDIYKNSCVKKWGSARKLQDPDESFRVVTIRVKDDAATVYVDGLHDGCASADTSAGDACSLSAPIAVTGATPQQPTVFRLGLMSADNAPATDTASSTALARLAGALQHSFANVDIAEMLIYKKALSPEEMDRVGNYLSVKFDLRQFRLNSFLRSPTRSVAVSARTGCDRILYKGHESKICDGYPGCNTNDEDTFVLSKRLADSDTDDYYIGMRAYITGGGGRTDKTTLSAKGQSCHITDYTAADRTVTCDLTNTGQTAYILWGGATKPCLNAGAECKTADVADAAAATDHLLTVTWVPTNWNTPYYAAIGDPAGDREVAKVLSVAIVGNKYQLTVIRNFAGTAAAALTAAHSKAFNAAATITFARSAVMKNIVANDLNILMAGLLKSCSHDGVDTQDPRCALASDTLPLSVDLASGNLKIKVTKKTPTVESLAVTNVKKLTWTLAGIAAAAGLGDIGATIDPAFDKLDVQNVASMAVGWHAVNPSKFNEAGAALTAFKLAAGDLLLLGSIGDGEIVRVVSADDEDSLTIQRGHSLPTPMQGRPTWTLLGLAGTAPAFTDGVVAADTAFVISGTVTTDQLPVNSLLLMGTVNTLLGVDTEVVKVTAVAAHGSNTKITVTRADGKKPDGSAATVAQDYPTGTTLTLLTKTHAATTTVVTLIGKDGEPLVMTKNAAAAVQNAAEGVIVDFAIVPAGGRGVQGVDFVGGSGVSTYKLEPCDQYLPPYVADGPVQIVQGQEYLKSPGAGFGGSFTADTRTTGNAFWMNADGVTASSHTGPVTAGASGGTVLELKGWYLAPSDIIIDGDTAGKVAAGSTVERNENFLLVTVGARPTECADPTQTTPCADGKYENREAALTCNLVETPGGYCEDDWTKSCKCQHDVVCAATCGANKKCKAGPAYGATTNWYPTAKSSMRCALPGTLNANQDLNIYWHGIKTTFTNWYRPHAPVVGKLEPSTAVYSGGDTVTIMGSNFGPRDVWTAVNKAGTKTTTTRTATVSFVGKGMAKTCDSLVYVSDKQLICKVPALANQKQDMDKAARTVAVSVVVDAGGLRSGTASSGSLTYSNVPTYFTCNSNEVSETGKNECFSCCRSACIVDEFALGAQKGGATYSHCDTSCYAFCGFIAQKK